MWWELRLSVQVLECDMHMPRPTIHRKRLISVSLEMMRAAWIKLWKRDAQYVAWRNQWAVFSIMHTFVCMHTGNAWGHCAMYITIRVDEIIAFLFQHYHTLLLLSYSRKVRSGATNWNMCHEMSILKILVAVFNSWVELEEFHVVVQCLFLHKNIFFLFCKGFRQKSTNVLRSPLHRLSLGAASFEGSQLKSARSCTCEFGKVSIWASKGCWNFLCDKCPSYIKKGNIWNLNVVTNSHSYVENLLLSLKACFLGIPYVSGRTISGRKFAKALWARFEASVVFLVVSYYTLPVCVHS